VITRGIRRWLTVREAARLLGVSYKSVWDRARRETLDSCVIDGRIMIAADSVAFTSLPIGWLRYMPCTRVRVRDLDTKA